MERPAPGPHGTARGRTGSMVIRLAREHGWAAESESLHWRNLTFANNLGDFVFADYRSTEIRNFSVDLLEGALGEWLRWRETFLEVTCVLLRAFDLIGRQRAKDSLHRFNFRHAMTKHHYVVSRREAQTNGVI